MPQFDVSTFTSQLFWLVLVFGFLYVIVSRVIAPKAESILTHRNKYIEENITASEEWKTKVHTLKDQKALKLKDLNTEVESLRSAAISGIDSIFAEKEKAMSSELSKKISDSAVEIQNYANSFHLAEPKFCIDLAALLIEKITDKPADLKLLKKIHGAK